jgi:hypothetical protein
MALTYCSPLRCYAGNATIPPMRHLQTRPPSTAHFREISVSMRYYTGECAWCAALVVGRRCVAYASQGRSLQRNVRDADVSLLLTPRHGAAYQRENTRGATHPKLQAMSLRSIPFPCAIWVGTIIRGRRDCGGRQRAKAVTLAAVRD